jgi:hypothetical protein
MFLHSPDLSVYGYLYLFIVLYGLFVTASVVQWSEFLATDPEARVRFPALPKKM